ncbi:hypothetical protein NDU88_007698 [Pleurodeles waltl]|uniref:L1 transposable element RRM domain-containing protein n=1 Tax=Pleurodeles waltl TaxID=8319 RepID=A0AAV7QSM1_PLEWA|nr:hypothetical protein NDU88_007698 [Pleurodeles waltl]
MGKIQKRGRQDGGSDSQEVQHVTPLVQVVPDHPLSHSIAEIIRDLAVEVRGSFETSSTNQKEIKGLCEALRQKFADLEERIVALEREVCDLRRATEDNRKGIQQVDIGEEKVQLILESMENNLRRNNLRFLKVPEGLEGRDLKWLVVHLIKQGMQIEEEEEDLVKDIQRVHRDPFRKNPKREKPRKILVCFHTYIIKEHILVAVLKKKTLTAEGIHFEIRSDLSKVTLSKQWELGQIIEVLKRLGDTAE